VVLGTEKGVTIPSRSRKRRSTLPNSGKRRAPPPGKVIALRTRWAYRLLACVANILEILSLPVGTVMRRLARVPLAVHDAVAQQLRPG
jgi:hypothetical protein